MSSVASSGLPLVNGTANPGLFKFGRPARKLQASILLQTFAYWLEFSRAGTSPCHRGLNNPCRPVTHTHWHASLSHQSVHTLHHKSIHSNPLPRKSVHSSEGNRSSGDNTDIDGHDISLAPSCQCTAVHRLPILTCSAPRSLIFSKSKRLPLKVRDSIALMVKTLWRTNADIHRHNIPLAEPPSRCVTVSTSISPCKLGMAVLIHTALWTKGLLMQ